MKITDFLKEEESKAIAWIQSKEPAFIAAMQKGYGIATEILTIIESKQAQTVEQVLIALQPKLAGLPATVIAVIEALAKDMLAVSSPSGIKAVALRLFAEILLILEGGKTIKTIDQAIAEAQTVFLG